MGEARTQEHKIQKQVLTQMNYINLSKAVCISPMLTILVPWKVLEKLSKFEKTELLTIIEIFSNQNNETLIE